MNLEATLMKIDIMEMSIREIEHEAASVWMDVRDENDNLDIKTQEFDVWLRRARKSKPFRDKIVAIRTEINVLEESI